MCVYSKVRNAAFAVFFCGEKRRCLELLMGSGGDMAWGKQSYIWVVVLLFVCSGRFILVSTSKKLASKVNPRIEMIV